MKKLVWGIFIVLLAAPFSEGAVFTSISSPAVVNAPEQTGRELTVPQRRRRRLRREMRRRRHRGIRHAFKKAGTSAGRGGQQLGQNIARGRVVRGGKKFGQGMGGFGKHTGKGMARIGKRIARP